jgi:hypothetical protein
MESPCSIPGSASAQTDSGAHSAFYPMGTGGLPPGLNWQEREADHSPGSSAEVKNGGAIRPVPHMSSWLNA